MCKKCYKINTTNYTGKPSTCQFDTERINTMAQKIDISDLKVEFFADKTVKNFTLSVADPESKLGLGNMAAEAAAHASALALRAVRKTASEDEAMKRAESDLETLRTYFVHLLDEENKARMPLEKRLAAGGPENEIEGGYRTACVIVDEILYSAIRMIEIVNEISDKVCPCTASLCAAAIYYAKLAMECVRLQLAVYSTKMNEEVYARTTRREPEIAIEGVSELANGLIKKFEDMIK